MRAGRAAVIIAFAVLAAFGQTAGAQEVDTHLWGVDPTAAATSVAVSGQTLYVGGAFQSVGPVVGGGAIVDGVTGVLFHDSPRVAGTVLVCVPDGHRGWYIGGDFTGVGGLPRHDVAHVFGDGRVDAWAPDVDGPVYALALSGNRVFLGGSFTSVNGSSRSNLAAVDREFGTLTDWNPGAIGFRVRALLATSSDLYVGGVFSNVGGHARKNLASVSLESGTVTPWDPQAQDDVFALAATGDTLFAGGAFVDVGGSGPARLAAFDLQTGSLLAWNAGVDRSPEYRFDCGPCVVALLVADDRLYVAGGFNIIGGASRPGLAALDVHTGVAVDWDPQVYTPPDAVPAEGFAIALRGSTLYFAGLSAGLGGMSFRFAGAIDTRSALALPWRPAPNFYPGAIAVSGERVFLGGGFTSVGPTVPRSGLAAFDLRTGEVTPWDPHIDGQPRALAVRDGTVYVGGSFASIGGQPRSNIAALDAATGQARDWNPGVSGPVWTLALRANSIYIGGDFASVGAQPRPFLAEVDLSSALPSDWNPSANDVVVNLVLAGDVVYASGLFSGIGPAARSYVAAIDAVTGLATDWNPAPDDLVNCFAIQDTTVYLGGYFNHVGGQARDAFAAVSATTGLASSMIANVDQQVKKIVVLKGIVYVGGAFRSIGNTPRFCLAALEPETGRVLDWNPDPDGVVWDMVSDDERLFPVGAFARMGVTPVSLLAAVTAGSLVSAPPPTSSSPRLQFVGVTNPCRSSGTVHFKLQADAFIDLDVFDSQGRRVRRLLSHSLQMAGEHELPVDTSGWPSGLYVYRLTGGSESASKKMVVLP
jgi:hypothetical protein